MTINLNLAKKINEVSIDQNFSLQSAKMGIHTLGDIMGMSILAIKSHPEFTQMWYGQILQILKREGLMDLFQDNLYNR